MSDKPQTLGSAITETILSEPVDSLVSEYAEIGIDAILSEGILKEIPFVHSLIAVTKIGITISDRLLINKLIKFLSAIQDVPSRERQEMVSRLELDPVFGRKVGEHILELLVRVEGKQKPKMLAQAFTAYAKNRIDVRALLRLNHAIEQLPNSELASVRPFYNRSPEEPFEFDTYTGQSLATAGLAEINAGFGGISFMKTELCRVFLELNLDV
ncbi:hypothetical protein [Pseudomonas sp. 2FE]|uniref:hypothetical protein n=1 Tax=Pseudomonas sp. 2FE TaxID=2502190 RepID=UPI0010F9FE5F|nr:hypothetical protein [Pseudomonas sp. 2FE]